VQLHSLLEGYSQRVRVPAVSIFVLFRVMTGMEELTIVDPVRVAWEQVKIAYAYAAGAGLREIARRKP
jgi:hypothetical protein